MTVAALLWRNLKWRFQNPVSILVTLIQPLIWLLIYGAAARRMLSAAGAADAPAFLLPGLMVLVTMGACSSAGMQNYLMKSSGSFPRLLTAPAGRWAIVLGQVLEAAVCALLEAAVLLAVSLCFGVRAASGAAGILCIAALLCAAALLMAGIAFTVSLLLPNEAVYETAMNTIVLPLFFLSTALFPAGSLTGWPARAARLNPFTGVIEAVRGLLTMQAVQTEAVLGALLPMAALGCASFALAVLRLRAVSSGS